MVFETVIKSVLDKGQSVPSTRTFFYLKQTLQNFSRGIGRHTRPGQVCEKVAPETWN